MSLYIATSVGIPCEDRNSFKLYEYFGIDVSTKLLFSVL